jgi:hypothetical protein
LKAPRLIARSPVAPVRWATLERPQGRSRRPICDLIQTPNPFGHPRPISCHSSRVKGAAAGGDALSTVTGRHGPGGRLAQLVRALP